MLPKPADLSYYNWETQLSTSNSTPHYQVRRIPMPCYPFSSAAMCIRLSKGYCSQTFLYPTNTSSHYNSPPNPIVAGDRGQRTGPAVQEQERQKDRKCQSGKQGSRRQHHSSGTRHLRVHTSGAVRPLNSPQTVTNTFNICRVSGGDVQ